MDRSGLSGPGKIAVSRLVGITFSRAEGCESRRKTFRAPPYPQAGALPACSRDLCLKSFRLSNLSPVLSGAERNPRRNLDRRCATRGPHNPHRRCIRNCRCALPWHQAAKVCCNSHRLAEVQAYVSEHFLTHADPSFHRKAERRVKRRDAFVAFHDLQIDFYTASLDQCFLRG